MANAPVLFVLSMAVQAQAALRVSVLMHNAGRLAQAVAVLASTFLEMVCDGPDCLSWGCVEPDCSK